MAVDEGWAIIDFGSMIPSIECSEDELSQAFIFALKGQAETKLVEIKAKNPVWPYKVRKVRIQILEGE